MNDYAGVMIATALFGFMCPGLLFQLPGRNRAVEFVSMNTSVSAIVLHTVVYGLLLFLFLVLLNVHIYL
ncbi:hypothetical protein ACP275_06G005900 [Erythranthe tilingii]